MELFGLVLGILALLLAIWHLREIKTQSSETRALARETHAQAEETRQQASELRSLAERLEYIRSSLSTRYIGEFPNYISDLASLVSKAKEEVLICCDFPAYGQFSDRLNWLEYSHEIQKRADKGVAISLACLSEGGRLRNHHEQFSKEEQVWEKWKEDVEERLTQFLKAHKKNLKIGDLTMDEFAALLEDTDKQMLNGPFGTATLHETDGDIPMYFWLVDRNEAIFAIPSFTNRQSEYGFFTSDPRLISALVELGEHYRSSLLDAH